MSKAKKPEALDVLERDLSDVEARISALRDERQAIRRAIAALGGQSSRPRRHDTGQKLRALVEAEPGLTTKQIAERLEISLPYVYGLVAKDASISRDETGVHYIP